VSADLGAGWALLAAALLLPAAAWRVFRGRGAPRAVVRLRLASFLLLAAALADPLLSRSERRPVPPRAAFLLDSGAAMAAPCAENPGLSRRDCAGNRLRGLLARLSAGASSALFYFPGADAPLQNEAPASFPAERDLGAALERLSSAPGGPWDAVFVLTSGHGLSFPPIGASRPGVTLIAVGAAGRRGLGEPRVSAPPFAYLHMPFRVFAEARLERAEAGEKASLEVLLPDGTPVSSAALRTDAYGVFAATFTLRRDAPGLAGYRLRARAGGFVSSSEFRVQAVREKLRVLHLSGSPSFDYAALRAQLKSDPGVDLVSFVILRDPEDAAGVPDAELSLIPFPAHDLFLKDLRNFDVLILHSFDLRRFAIGGIYLQAVERFVSGGGGLLVIGGPRSFGSGGYASLGAFAALLPAEISASPDHSRETFSVVPAAHPAASPEVFGGPGAPVPAGLNLLGGPVGGASLIYGYRTASGASGALAAARTHGRGRVVALASPSTWTLKAAGGGRYSAFWDRLLSFLDGTLGLERATLEAGGSYPPRLRLRVLDENYLPLERDSASVEAEVSGAGGVRGLDFYFRGAGVYEAEVPPPYGGGLTASARVSVSGRPAGRARLSFSPRSPSAHEPAGLASLQAAAAPRGWKVARMEDLSAEGLAALLPPSAEEEARIWSAAPGRSPWLLALFLLLLAAELSLRRLAGRD